MLSHVMEVVIPIKIGLVVFYAQYHIVQASPPERESLWVSYT